MTTAIYAGGISLTSYPVVCQAVSSQFLQFKYQILQSNRNVRQVGIALHYSSLSTLLWIGVSARVIYKEALWRLPRQPEGEPPAVPTQRPMLRSVDVLRHRLTSGVRLLFTAREFAWLRTDVGAVVAATTQSVCRQSEPLCPLTEVPL